MVEILRTVRFMFVGLLVRIFLFSMGIIFILLANWVWETSIIPVIGGITSTVVGFIGLVLLVRSVLPGHK